MADLPESKGSVELVVNESKTPVLRAGYANLLFVLAPIFALLLDKVLSEKGLVDIYRAGVLVFIPIVFLGMYSVAVSRINLAQSGLCFVCSFKTVRIPLQRIQDVSLFEIPSCLTACLRVKEKGRIFPHFFYFIAVSTNLGPFSETVRQLREKFSRRNVTLQAQRGDTF